MTPNYAEFNDSRLVAIYNTVCPLDGYEKFYIELAKKLSAKTIIDLGCGTGLLTCELAKAGFQMTGVEPSKLMLEVARRSACGKQVKWVEGDALSLGELDTDLAIMTGHVAQFYLEDDYWEKALVSIRKALRPGGYLSFESRNPDMQPWATTVNYHIKWYESNVHKKIIDPVKGEIELWTNIVEVKDNKAITDIHYLFTATGEELVSRNELVFRNRNEIEQSLRNAGFLVENVYGNWNWTEVSDKSPEFIFVAKVIDK